MKKQHGFPIKQLVKLASYTSIFLVLSFFLIFLFAQESAAKNIYLKIGLATNQKTGSISSKSRIYCKDASGRTLKVSGRILLKTHSLSSKKIYINNKCLSLPITIHSKTPIYWNKRPYRGWFKLYPSSNGFNVINIVEIEQYLRGVLKMEVNPSWEMEALKAQAIVARTYALRNRGKHRSQGFDLCALPHCQVYRGINAEDPRINRAIASTKGLVLYYGNNLAVTPYHSDSGGYTANVWEVWSGHMPYLKAKKEPFSYVSPYSNWKVMIPLSELKEKLRKNRISVGEIRRVSIPERDKGGRAVSVLIEGTRGKVKIKASKFRIIVGSSKVKSTNFKINGNSQNVTTTNNIINQPVEEEKLYDHEGVLFASFIKKGVFSTEELMDMLVHPEKKSHYLRLALQRQSGIKSKHSFSRYSTNGKVLILEGKGWGHGVGMSQWGAKAMAEHGWNFKKILMYYYPGTKLRKVY
ncbi:MAG: SpoIID/LytB domain-containing protein [Thermovirga sp.]|nr:SpoIID/LytB domain-containing protein [Thermovirga sp.]